MQRTVALGDVHLVAGVQCALKNATDGDAAKVIGVVKVRNENLQRGVRVARGRRNRRDNRRKERLQVHTWHREIDGRRSRLGHSVEHRKIQLRLIGVQVDEQVVNLVQHFLRACVRAVDFVNDHDGRQLGLQRFGQHVASLGQRALGGVHKQHDAVHHLQSALHLAAEVGVARRIDNVDFAAAKVDGRVLGENGDAALPLQFV